MIIHNKPFEENLRLVALRIAQAGEKYKDLDLYQLAQDLDFSINSRASITRDCDCVYDDGYSDGYEAAIEEVKNITQRGRHFMKQSVLEKCLKELSFNIEMLAQTNKNEEELLMYVRQLDDLVTNIHFYGVEDDKAVDLNSLKGNVPYIFKKRGDS